MTSRIPYLLAHLLLIAAALGCDDHTDPVDPCADIAACVENVGLVVHRPEIVWEQSTFTIENGQRKADAGDTIVIRVLVENRAELASPTGSIHMGNGAARTYVELPGLPPHSEQVLEARAVIPAYTFAYADTLKPVVELQQPHGLTATYVEGATVIPLVGSGYQLRIIDDVDSLRVGIPDTFRIRIINPYGRPVLADSLTSCIFDIDFCPIAFPQTATPAIAPGDSMTLAIPVTVAADRAVWWYEQITTYYRLHCLGGLQRCVHAPVTLLPNFALTCAPQPLPQLPAAVTAGTPLCSPDGAAGPPGSLYAFDAVAGTTYHAEIVGADGRLAFSDENGVRYEFLSNRTTHDFTATRNGRHYLILLHSGEASFRITSVP